MEQQMTSEKQMTVHWHISADFPPPLQQRIIFPMCLFPWWLLDFYFLLLLFLFVSGFKLIQPWHIFANTYTCLSSWRPLNQSRGPSLQTSVIGSRHADDNKKSVCICACFLGGFFYICGVQTGKFDSCQGLLPSKKVEVGLKSGLNKDLGLYKEERKG